MGNTVNIAKQHVDSEFERIAKQKNTSRDYLILEEVLQIQPMKIYALDFSHLGTLFTLDKKKDGQFTKEEFYDFIQLCAQREAKFKQHDFQNQIQAYCTLCMWRDVSKNGTDSFVKWFCLLFEQNTTAKEHHRSLKSSKSFRKHSGSKIKKDGKEGKKSPKADHEMCSYQSIEVMHQLLNIRTSYGINCQNFYDLMRSSADEQSLLKGRSKASGVPIEVVKDFALQFIRGFVDLMVELGFEPSMNLDLN